MWGSPYNNFIARKRFVYKTQRIKSCLQHILEEKKRFNQKSKHIEQKKKDI